MSRCMPKSLKAPQNLEKFKIWGCSPARLSSSHATAHFGREEGGGAFGPQAQARNINIGRMVRKPKRSFDQCIKFTEITVADPMTRIFGIEK